MENSTKTKTPTNYGGVISLTSVFFFWGFIAAGNSVFIPFCKNYFHLDQFQSQLIDFAFYSAYYLGALAIFIIGSRTGKDLVGSWGYKKSIVYGLVFSALGAGAMILSVNGDTFYGMLLGLFIVALGFSLQQTSANPFMIALGDEATGSSRINLGGGINSLGTTVGPLIVALALFGSAGAMSDEAIANLPLDKVIYLYSCVGLLFLGIAVMFGTSKKVPSGIHDEKIEKAGKALGALLVITGLIITCLVPVFSSYLSMDQKKIESIEKENTEIMKGVEANYKLTTNPIDKKLEKKRSAALKELYPEEMAIVDMKGAEIRTLKLPLEQKRMIWLTFGLLFVISGLLYANFKGKKEKQGWGAMQYPQLTLGMLAIFVYVGVEVAVGSNLGELLKKPSFKGLSASQIAPYVAMFWGSLMIGRWTGAINAFELSVKTKNLLKFVVPLVAFGVILALSKASGYDVSQLYWYILCVFVQIGAFFYAQDKPAKTLMTFGILGLIATCFAVFGSGNVAIYGVLSAGLFLSIMWPSIFSLSLAGLGKYQAQGSAFLVMMILGGGFIPLIQGKFADLVDIQVSYILSVLCFAFLAWFAFRVKSILKKQGLNFE
jgi:FHS family L-fucose permease-like MFS transporter